MAILMKHLAIITLLFVATVSHAADPAPAATLKVVMFSGSSEYNSNDSLTAFKKILEEKHHCQCTVNVVEEKGTQLTGIEGLDTADVAVFFTRRVSLSPDQIEKVKKFIASGKGVVGIRTASHGFQTWLGFDPEILGGSYNNHYGNDAPADVMLEEKGKDHPILASVKPFTTTGKLYKNPKIADDATILLRAKTPDYAEPVAWSRDTRPNERGRVFYTSLGTPKDFEIAEFQQLLTNAVFWTASKSDK
jgi:type 1 glutamine amidotransferase